MPISLKDINRPALVLVVVANVILYYTNLFGFDVLHFSNLMMNYESYVPGVFLALIVGILNSQLDHITKARLVFWRWQHPLPGSCAFTEIMITDDRIDPASLRAVADLLPERVAVLLRFHPARRSSARGWGLAPRGEARIAPSLAGAGVRRLGQHALGADAVAVL